MNACSAGVLACGFTVLSSTVLWAGLGTRKSPKPADKNVCATALMYAGKKREQARRTPNAGAKLFHHWHVGREAFGVRPAYRRFWTRDGSAPSGRHVYSYEKPKHLKLRPEHAAPMGL